MGNFREATEERGSGPDYLRKVLLCGGLGSATLWVGNLGVYGSDAAKNEGAHMGFLWQVAGIKARKLGVKTWKEEGVDRVLQAAGTKPIQEYIDRRQATVA